MEHSLRWGTTGTDTKWETRTKGNENEGGHTGSGLDRSYLELTGVVSERVLTGHQVYNTRTSVLDRATTDCFLDNQDIAPLLSMNAYLQIE